MASSTSAVPSIHGIIESRSVITEFQPLVSARQKSIVGLEALSRGAVPGQNAITPITLFRMASRQGVADRLDEVCREEAVRRFAGLTDRTDDLILFLNVDVQGMEKHPPLAADLRRFVVSAGLHPSRVAVEILEAEIGDVEHVRRLTTELRECGFLIVLDDVGAGHSNLNRIPVIKPDVLKVDRSLIAQINADYHKQETLKSLVSLSRKIGALVVAEGVETELEAMVALELGVDLLQGYFLGKPREDGALTAASAHIEGLARTFRDYMVGKIAERKMRHQRLTVIMNQILCQITHAPVEQFERILGAIMTQHPDVECIYVLDHAGIQVTPTLCHETLPRLNGEALFRATAKGADHSLKEYCYMLLDVELQKYVTDPYVSLASGNLIRTISTRCREAQTDGVYLLCLDCRV